MTNQLLLAAIAFGLTLRFGWFDQCKRNRTLAGGVQQIAEELRQLVEAGDKCLNPQLCPRPKMISQPRHHQR